MGLFTAWGRDGANSHLEADQYNLLSDAAQRTTGVATDWYKQKLFVQSGVMDLTIENNATLADLVTPCDMEVDIYEIAVKKDIYVDDATQANRDIYDFINLCTAEQTVPNVADLASGGPITGATALTTLQPGWTPFQSSKMCEYFKILRKQKNFMTPGAFFTYQVKMGPREIVGTRWRYATGTGVADINTLPVYTRGTKVIMFICKGEPKGTAWSIPSMTVGMTKTFNYKMIKDGTNVAYVK